MDLGCPRRPPTASPVALGRAISRFSRTVELNRWVGCETTAIIPRTPPGCTGAGRVPPDDLASLYLPKPQQNIDQGGLTRPAGSYDRQMFSLWQVEMSLLQTIYSTAPPSPAERRGAGGARDIPILKRHPPHIQINGCTERLKPSLPPGNVVTALAVIPASVSTPAHRPSPPDRAPPAGYRPTRTTAGLRCRLLSNYWAATGNGYTASKLVRAARVRTARLTPSSCPARTSGMPIARTSHIPRFVAYQAPGHPPAHPGLPGSPGCA